MGPKYKNKCPDGSERFIRHRGEDDVTTVEEIGAI